MAYTATQPYYKVDHALLPAVCSRRKIKERKQERTFNYQKRNGTNNDDLKDRYFLHFYFIVFYS